MASTNHRLLLLGTLLLCPLASGCSPAKHPDRAAAIRLIPQDHGFRAENSRLALECSRTLRLRVFLKRGENWVTLSPAQGLPQIASALTGEGQAGEFSLLGSPVLQAGIKTPFGEADRIQLEGQDATRLLGLTLHLDFPRRYADVVVIETSLKNLSNTQSVALQEVSQASLHLRPGTPATSSSQTLFWSLQGGGYRWSADYIFPVRAGFAQDNDTGPKGKGNGGGFPFVDLWRPEMGVAVALLDPQPARAWAPVQVSAQGVAQVQVTTRPSLRIPPGGTYAPSPVMIAVHAGDFYDPVARYRQLMGDLDVQVVNHYEPDDYAAAWCTWGFQRTFTTQAVLAKLPQMKALGMKELILDDGWFDRFGDWQPTRRKFPRGEADLKELIGRVHAEGLKFRLWWSPGSADPGSAIDRQHPDWFILDQEGRREKASWNAYYLCPAYAPVRAATRELVKRFVADWSVDSFKLDGTCLNHAPLCYNPAHHHARPEESFEQWPNLFREIREAARALRPDFRIELCPCGITPTFQLATAFEQPTDSDPHDYQVTARVKFLKAMFGPRSPVLQEYVGLLGQREPNGTPYGFRVELFPRAIGTGQVVSTFSPMLGKSHARWVAIYNQHRPAEGEYLNLYDLRWENPEGHVIRKGEKFYYGFFTQEPGKSFSGKIQLRGLAPRRYQVTDYAAGRVLAEVAGAEEELSVSFKDSLLLVAEPL